MAHIGSLIKAIRENTIFQGPTQKRRWFIFRIPTPFKGLNIRIPTPFKGLNIRIPTPFKGLDIRIPDE